MTKRLFKTAAAWRAWLKRNHAREKEIWLVYYKKGSGKTSVTYEEALQEALCYGWIDSIVSRLDDERYMQKYTPRNVDSIWSAGNKERVRKLIAQGRMAAPGMAKIDAAKRNGSWDKLSDIDRIGRTNEIPEDLRWALAGKKEAARIIERVKTYLVQNPVGLGTPLKGIFKGLFRYRSGMYRVIYAVDMAEKKIIVLHVKHRKEAYR